MLDLVDSCYLISQFRWIQSFYQWWSIGRRVLLGPNLTIILRHVFTACLCSVEECPIGPRRPLEYNNCYIYKKFGHGVYPIFGKKCKIMKKHENQW